MVYTVVECAHFSYYPRLAMFMTSSCFYFFGRCPDLEDYVKELNPNKRTVLLLNKADLLPLSVRKAWATHFRRENTQFAFFSAALEHAKLEEEDRYLHGTSGALEAFLRENRKPKTEEGGDEGSSVGAASGSYGSDVGSIGGSDAEGDENDATERRRQSTGGLGGEDMTEQETADADRSELGGKKEEETAREQSNEGDRAEESGTGTWKERSLSGGEGKMEESGEEDDGEDQTPVKREEERWREEEKSESDSLERACRLLTRDEMLDFLQFAFRDVLTLDTEPLHVKKAKEEAAARGEGQEEAKPKRRDGPAMVGPGNKFVDLPEQYIGEAG